MTDNLIGRTFGDFRIDRPIGRGAAGRVYAATQVSLKRRVALKVFDEGSLTLFRRGAELVAALEHPNIVPVYAFGEESDRLYCAMRFVEGRTLEELMTEGLSLRDGLRYIADVAGALEYAHARGVVHGDLKPANVLIASGSAMLTDFGLAGSSDAPADLRALGAILRDIAPADAPPPVADLIAALTAADPAALLKIVRDDGSEPLKASEPTDAKVFGKFRLMEQLGRGGMGAVFRARQTDLKRDVALKVMNFGPDADASAVERFRREAKAVARLRHANIIAVHEAGEIDGRPYFSMDLIEGRSLSKLLESGPPPLRRSMEIMRDVAAAVAYAHAKAVVHRDLKPANILLDAEGRVFVADFGLAKSIDVAGTQLTQSGEIMGTPAYMAPEQARGSSGLVDPRTDVYGMGAVLYHLLTGAAPFDRADVVHILSDVLSTDPPPPRGRNPRIHVDAETICLKAMEKDPSRRYKGAAEFKADVDRFLAGEPIEARPIRGLTRGYRRLKRHPAIVALACAIVILLGVGTTLLISRQAAHRRRTEARELAREAALSYLARNFTEAESRARRAADVDPSWGPAWFWLARLDLRRYAEGRGIPGVWVSFGDLEFDPMKRETPPAALLRTRAVQTLERAKSLDGMKDWEGAFAVAVTQFFAEHYADARAAFAALKVDVPERELDAYRALCAYYARDFPGALKASRDAVGRWGPGAENFGLIEINALLACGLELTLRGEDPNPDYYDPALAAAMQSGDKVALSRVLTHQGLWQEGRGGDAMTLFRRAVDALKDLQTPDALLARGDAQLALAESLAGRGEVDPDRPAEFESALATYTAAVDDNDPQPGALFRRAEARASLANLLYGWGRFERVPEMNKQTYDDYDRVCSIGPAYLDARLGRALWRCAIRRSESRDRVVEHPKIVGEFIQEIEAVVRDFPDRSRGPIALGAAWTDMAKLELFAGKPPFASYEKAVSSYERAVEDRGSNAEPHLALAGAYAELQSVHSGFPYVDVAKAQDYRDRALAEFERARAINPKDLRCLTAPASRWVESANLKVSTGGDPEPDFASALKVLDQAEAAHPRPLMPLLQRGILELVRHRRGAPGALDRADAALRKALTFNENHSDVLGNLAEVCALRFEAEGKGDLRWIDEAVDFNTRALRRERHDVQSWADQARYLILHGRATDDEEARTLDFNDALKCCEEAFKRDPAHHDALLWKGIGLVERGLRDRDDARQEKDLLGAVAALESATTQYAQEFSGLISLGFAHTGLGLLLNERGEDGKPRFEKAVKAYRAAEAVEPLPPGFQVELCRALVMAERWDEAAKLLPSLPPDLEMVRALKTMIEKHGSDF